MVLFRENRAKVCAMRQGDRNTDKCASHGVARCAILYKKIPSSTEDAYAR